MKRAPPSMSERQRVLLALQGKRCPREGEYGLFTSWGIRRGGHARVEVVRVSSTGKTIWTRFATDGAYQRFGWRGEDHRWWRVSADDFMRYDFMIYRAGFDSILAPPGEISFPDVLPEDTI